MPMSTAELAEILKRRGVKTIQYFHADHYEPWSSGIHEQSARGVERFAEMSRTSRFGGRMSLFYCVFVPYSLDLIRTGPGRRAGERDAVVFRPRTKEQEALARKVIAGLFEPGFHEAHLHVHHEFWTRNDSHFEPEVSKWVNAHSNAEMDRDRLDLAFGLCKETISREIGRPFDRWGFVHGNWALAASDPSICTVESELGIIMRHGGFGDFSFPAGRPHCDPALEVPFTCRPIEAKRAYDDPASDPRPLTSGSRVLSPKRFFIWNSPIKAQYSSLDYYSESNRDLFKNPSRILEQWLANSVAYGSDLFIKTHAHSMKWEYEIHKPGSLIPHLYPDVVTIFEELLRVCDLAGVEFRPVTVNEVMSTLEAVDQGDVADRGKASDAPRRKIAPPAPLAGARTTTVSPAAAPAPPPPPPLAGGRAAAVTPAAAKTGGSNGKRVRNGAAKEGAGLDKVATLDAILMTALRNWVKEVADRSEGAGDFYLEILKGKHLLQDYERAVLDYIVVEMPPERTTIVEVGIGYGVLSLFLAAAGYQVIGCEGSRARLDGFEFLTATLDRHAAGTASRVKALHGWFPDSFDAGMLDPDRRNVLIATNVVATATADRQEAILEAMKSFADIIVDTTRFGVIRYETAAAEELHRRIAAHRQPVAAIWRRKPNEIWHFHSQAPAEKPASQVEAPLANGAAGVSLEHFSAELLALQREWQEGDGRKLAHDDLYAAKIGRGTALEVYETAVADAVIKQLDPARANIVEIGAGQGALSLFLGRHGFAVQGYEGDRRRVAAAARNLQRQQQQHPELSVRFASGFFPDAGPTAFPDTDKDRICIATNITCTYTDTHREQILDAVSDFDEFIFDLARFGRSRNSQQERDDLRQTLINHGFEPIERLYFAEPYEYWRFRTPAAVEARRSGVARARPVAPPVPPMTEAPPSAAPSPPAQARAIAAKADSKSLFPLSDDVGLIFSVFGDKRLDACPVCGGHATAELWRMPMSNLDQPITTFAGYYHQAPSLQIPALVFCFDHCRDCQSIYLNPVSGDRKAAHGANEHHIRIMQEEAAWRGYEEVFDRFAKSIPETGGTIVDAACGVGQYLEVARKRMPDRWRRLVGLELSGKYVEHMRARGIEAHVFDLDADPMDRVVKTDSADLVFFCEAFQYLEHPMAAMRKLLGALRPGGRLCFTALRYGRDVQAGVRPSEPIYVGQKLIALLPDALGCRLVDVQTSAMRYYITLEK